MEGCGGLLRASVSVISLLKAAWQYENVKYLKNKHWVSKRIFYMKLK